MTVSLSTHVLDTMHGTPVSGVGLRLLQSDQVIFSGVTDGDGRCPDLRTQALSPGAYRLEFTVADYFRGRGIVLPEPPFLNTVVIDFGLSDGHYHVPLLVSPFSYSTYRGS